MGRNQNIQSGVYDILELGVGLTLAQTKNYFAFGRIFATWQSIFRGAKMTRKMGISDLELYIDENGSMKATETMEARTRNIQKYTRQIHIAEKMLKCKTKKEIENIYREEHCIFSCVSDIQKNDTAWVREKIEREKKYDMKYLEEELQKDFLSEMQKEIEYIRKRNENIVSQIEKNLQYFENRKKEAAISKEKNRRIEFGEYEGKKDTALRRFFGLNGRRLYLVEASNRWRCTLWAETEVVGGKGMYGGLWSKTIPTGKLFLLGKDDNGQNWEIEANYENFGGEYELDFDDIHRNCSILKMMAFVFDCTEEEVQKSKRQGDILVCPIGEGTTEEKPTEQTIRGTHTFPGVQKEENVYILPERTSMKHPSHAPIELEAGTYKIFESQRGHD